MMAVSVSGDESQSGNGLKEFTHVNISTDGMGQFHECSPGSMVRFYHSSFFPAMGRMVGLDESTNLSIEQLYVHGWE